MANNTTTEKHQKKRCVARTHYGLWKKGDRKGEEGKTKRKAWQMIVFISKNYIYFSGRKVLGALAKELKRVSFINYSMWMRIFLQNLQQKGWFSHIFLQLVLPLLLMKKCFRTNEWEIIFLLLDHVRTLVWWYMTWSVLIWWTALRGRCLDLLCLLSHLLSLSLASHC